MFTRIRRRLLATRLRMSRKFVPAQRQKDIDIVTKTLFDKDIPVLAEEASEKLADSSEKATVSVSKAEAEFAKAKKRKRVAELKKQNIDHDLDVVIGIAKK